MAPMGEPQYGGAAPGGSSAARSDRFSHRASYLADEYPRSMGPSQLSGPGMPGPSRSVLYPAAADSQVVLHEELLARFGRAAHNHPYASPARRPPPGSPWRRSA
ncbi:hypothetical protein A0H81_06738 [Grifola frondosa]|uniref:Uncharacterized protein n=1 Tax=Grifola frondosa TaxID=5627 RepID=A0A1C7M7M0_GRIFR|nr:hypothetical protein A0H81_06738 [Grifola frondosa]